MFISNSVKETVAAGREIAARAGPGDVFALVGDLGAGKTQLVKGIAAGLSCAAEVTSPTFTLVHEYSGGRLPLYHFDFYRMQSPDEVLQLGFDDYAFGDGVTVVEWADRFPQLLPTKSEWLEIKTRGESSRVIDSLGQS